MIQIKSLKSKIKVVHNNVFLIVKLHTHPQPQGIAKLAGVHGSQSEDH